MIALTRLKGAHLVVNAELIEFVEALPDTVITLTTGRKLIVLESPDEVVARVLTYRQTLQARRAAPPAADPLMR